MPKLQFSSVERMNLSTNINSFGLESDNLILELTLMKDELIIQNLCFIYFGCVRVHQ